MNIQQLREQIATLQDATMDSNGNFLSDYDEGKFDALTAIDNLLDSLREEPNDVVDKYLYGKEPELVDEDDLPTKKDYRERYKRIAESEAFKKTHEGISIGEVIPVDGATPKVFEDMLNATTAAESLGISSEEYDRMVDECIFGEEPVSDDLEVELNKYIKDHFTIDKEQLDRFGLDEKDYMYSMDRSDMLALVEHFTNWQKKKDNKWLADNHKQIFNNGYEEGFEAGRDDMSEEMLKDAIDATVHIDAGGYPYIPQIELYDYDKDIPLAKEGEKVKVIVIKED
jgi:hypothetical protein